ncbi:MAG: DUF1080 domain-containing protein [Candidatus Solibacter sp.]
MKKYSFLLLLLAWATAASAQKNAFAGRWDLVLTPASGAPYPQWMEITEKGGTLEGRFQPRGGAWQPLSAVTVENAHLMLTISAATQRNPATTWDFTAAGADRLTGVEKRGETAGPQIAAVRAPALDRKMPRSWSKPAPIFNGKDLTGWEPIGNVQNSKWVARDGELVNDNPEVAGQAGPAAANIKTTQKWQDFKLHVEVNCPEHGNSGIYLRGRYEMQVGTEGGTQPSHEMGAIFSHFPAAGNLPLGLGKWSTFDITLVGRRVTVIRDGVKIQDSVEIPGPTGGALDSNEGEPGPFYLQGDHHGVIRYRNLTISVPK